MEERLAVRLRRQLVWWIILAVLFWGFWFLLPIWTYRLARATGSGMGSAVAYAVFSLLFPVNLILWGILFVRAGKPDCKPGAVEPPETAWKIAAVLSMTGCFGVLAVAGGVVAGTLLFHEELTDGFRNFLLQNRVRLAERGGAARCYKLGINYLYGEYPCPEDYDEALRWFRKAAAEGDAAAEYMVGECHYYGHGTDEDISEALNWYRKAAEHGYVYGQLDVADILSNGDDGVKADPVEAFFWYGKAAEQKNPRATARLGICYEEGEGVKADPAKAFEYYRKAAELESPLGCYRLALAHAEGIGTEVSSAEAVRWMERAVNLNYSRAINTLGIWYRQGRQVPHDPVRAFELFGQAAEAGFSFGKINLALCYLHGRGTEQDQEKGVKILRKLDRDGNTAGTALLADCYQWGWGIPEPDLAGALKLYRRAAEQEDATALYQLAILYRDGIGVEPDPALARSYLKRAAEAGDDDADELLDMVNRIAVTP